MKTDDGGKQKHPVGWFGLTTSNITGGLVVAGVLAAITVVILVVNGDGGNSGDGGNDKHVVDSAAVTPSPTAATVTASPTPSPPPTPPPTVGVITPTPGGVDLPAGQPFQLDPAWYWVCTGDVDVYKSDNTIGLLHDDDPTTGMVLTVPPSASFKLVAVFGGHCTATTEDGLAAMSALRQAEMLGGKNCEDHGCTSLQLVTVDVSGNIVP